LLLNLIENRLPALRIRVLKKLNSYLYHDRTQPTRTEYNTMSIYTSENRIYWAKYDSLLGVVPILSEVVVVVKSFHVSKSSCSSKRVRRRGGEEQQYRPAPLVFAAATLTEGA
jgi:hypothetical protein